MISGPVRRRLGEAAVLSLPLALVLIVPASHGVFRSYAMNADPDIVFAGQALELNSGNDHINAEHTGYIYFLLLSVVLKLLRVLGIIPIASVEPMLLLDGNAFDHAFGEVIYAGRMLSMLLAAMLVALIFCAAKVLTQSPWTSGLAAALAAASLGTAAQSLILRTELLSSIFVLAAFVAIILAGRETGGRNAVLLATAGFAAALALATKLQTVFPLLAIPVLAIALGQRPPPYAGRMSPAERSHATLLLALVATAVALPVVIMLVTGMAGRASPGLYQSLILAYLVVAVSTYAITYRISGVDAVAGGAALVLGFAAGFLVHLIHPNPAATDAIAAFVEHMKVYTHFALDSGPLHESIIRAVGNALRAAANHRLSTSAYVRDPMRFVEMALIAAMVAGALMRQRRATFEALALYATSLAVEVSCRMRGLPYHYIVYVDPWLILAAARMSAGLVPSPGNWARAAMTAATLAVVMLQLRVSLGPGFPERQPDDNACLQARGYIPRLAPQFEKFCFRAQSGLRRQLAIGAVASEAARPSGLTGSAG